MSGAHTPGPWEISRSSLGYPYQIRAPRGNPGPGGITNVTRWAAIGFPTSSEGEANARLISAAPELLEALEAAYRFITQPKRMEHPDPGAATVLVYETRNYNGLTGQLRAAITKATGQ